MTTLRGVMVLLFQIENIYFFRSKNIRRIVFSTSSPKFYIRRVVFTSWIADQLHLINKLTYN